MNKLPPMVLLALVFMGCGGGGQQDHNDGDTEDTEEDSTADHIAADIEGDGPQSDTVIVPDNWEICGEDEFNVGRVIPDMLILLDRSRSMTMSEPPLWNVIRDALVTVTSATDDGIWFGLMSFPNSIPPDECLRSSNQCSAPTDALVPVGLGTSGEIERTLDDMDTCGATPTAMSLQGAHQYLRSLADDHPKYILLATDGAPNCNTSLDGDTCRCTTGNCRRDNEYCLDDARTYTVLDEACADGISTFVLGMGGASEWVDVLEQMADHGCTDTYYAAQDPEQIQEALDEITGSIVTCQYEVNCADILDTSKVNYYFDGEVVPRDTSHENGWDWIDPCDSTSDTRGAIEFFGSHCESIMNREVGTISATYGCPTAII